MKVAVFLDAGVMQVVLTPEDDWEKSVVSSIEDFGEATLLRGSFYECRGGWVRQGTSRGSVILRLDKKKSDGWDGSLPNVVP